MSDNFAIVNPVKGKKPPQPGPIAIVAATESDLQLLARMTGRPVAEQRKLYMSTLYVYAMEKHRFSLIGPVIGAPYATMIIETLLVWGVRQILFIGWCGAVSGRVKAGDIIVPDSAMVDEGTSGHYLDPQCRVALPSRHLLAQTHRVLDLQETPFHEGAIWTTDAIFRETVDKVRHYQMRGALAVEMELSAVFTVAAFRDAEAAGILAVSDEVSTYQWKPGFRSAAFKTARQAVCGAALTIAGCPDADQKSQSTEVLTPS